MFLYCWPIKTFDVNDIPIEISGRSVSTYDGQTLTNSIMRDSTAIMKKILDLKEVRR